MFAVLILRKYDDYLSTFEKKTIHENRIAGSRFKTPKAGKSASLFRIVQYRDT